VSASIRPWLLIIVISFLQHVHGSLLGRPGNDAMKLVDKITGHIENVEPYYHHSQPKVVPYEQHIHLPQELMHKKPEQLSHSQLVKAAYKFGNQGGSRPAHHVAEHFNGKEEVRTQMADAFRQTVEETRRYLRGRERKYERKFGEKDATHVPARLEKVDSDLNDDGRYGTNVPVSFNHKSTWNIKQFVRDAGLKAAPNYYYGDGFGKYTHKDRPRKDVYPYQLKQD